MEKYEYYKKKIVEPEVVLPKKIYYAYKGGQSFACDSLCEAKKISSMVETVETNKEAVAEYKRELSKWRLATYASWKADLREECEYMNELGVFDDFMSYIDNEQSLDIDDIPYNMGIFDDIMRKIVQKNG